jgi:hypothetical protein
LSVRIPTGDPCGWWAWPGACTRKTGPARGESATRAAVTKNRTIERQEVRTVAREKIRTDPRQEIRTDPRQEIRTDPRQAVRTDERQWIRTDERRRSYAYRNDR